MTDEELDLLVPVADKFGVSVALHESIFQSLLSSKPADVPAEVWIEKKLPVVFPSATQRPTWLQESEWPVGDNGPLLFVGQLDVNPNAALRFHDLTTFYVFYDPSSGEVETVIQQA